MHKQRNIDPQNSNFVWNDTMDNEIVEILAATIKRFKQQEKQASQHTPCAPSV